MRKTIVGQFIVALAITATIMGVVAGCQGQQSPASPTQDNSGNGVPLESVEYQGNKYLVVLDGRSWLNAKAFAEFQGGHLVTISDAQENDFVANLAKQMGAGDSFWIGLLYAVNDGAFNWSTGEPLTYDNWASGEPNGKDFGLIALGGRWHDEGSGNLPFIVEFESGTTPPAQAAVAPNVANSDQEQSGIAPNVAESAPRQSTFAPNTAQGIPQNSFVERFATDVAQSLREFRGIQGELTQETQRVRSSLGASSNFLGIQVATEMDRSMGELALALDRLGGAGEAGAAWAEMLRLQGVLGAMNQYLAEADACCTLQPEHANSFGNQLANLEIQVNNLQVSLNQGIEELAKREAAWSDACCYIVIHELRNLEGLLYREGGKFSATYDYRRGDQFVGNQIAGEVESDLDRLGDAMTALIFAQDAPASRTQVFQLQRVLGSLQQHIAEAEDCCSLRPAVADSFGNQLANMEIQVNDLQASLSQDIEELAKQNAAWGDACCYIVIHELRNIEALLYRHGAEFRATYDYRAGDQFVGNQIAGEVENDLEQLGDAMTALIFAQDAPASRMQVFQLQSVLGSLQQHIAEAEDCCSLRPAVGDSLGSQLANMKIQVNDLQASLNQDLARLAKQEAAWADACCVLVIDELRATEGMLHREGGKFSATYDYRRGDQFEGNQIADKVHTQLGQLSQAVSAMNRAQNALAARDAVLGLQGVLGALEGHIAEAEDCCSLRPEVLETFGQQLANLEIQVDALQEQVNNAP